MSSTLKTAISAALNNGPARNFINTEDARAIVSAARADGKVTAEEVQALEALKLQPSFFDDNAFGVKGFPRPTAGGAAYPIINDLLEQSSVTRAVDASLGWYDASDTGIGAPQSANFMTGGEAERVVRAAKADGVIDAQERSTLEGLMGGWTYHDDSAAQTAGPFAEPTLSMLAGTVIQRALKGE